jgi:hypothetical protein
MLILEDPGGEPLDRFLGEPMELNRFLRFFAWRSALPLRWASSTSKVLSKRISNRPTCW